MCSFRWQDRIRPSRQQITTILLIVASVAALLPTPFVSIRPTTGKDRSRPFPCQDRPCGCRSAEQCKKKCCCFTSQQKLAWAKRNGVKPSDVVVLAADDTKSEAVMPRKACCSTNRIAATQVTNQSPKSTSPLVPRYRLVIGVIAQECQGVAQSVSGQSVFVIPPIVALIESVESNGERIILTGWSFEQPIGDPPVPPPRIIAA